MQMWWAAWRKLTTGQVFDIGTKLSFYNVQRHSSGKILSIYEVYEKNFSFVDFICHYTIILLFEKRKYESIEFYYKYAII